MDVDSNIKVVLSIESNERGRYASNTVCLRKDGQLPDGQRR